MAIAPPRIAMLAIHSSPTGPLGTRDTGGMSVYLNEASQRLARLGYSIDIYTCAGSPQNSGILYPGVRLIHLDAGNHAGDLKAHLPGLVDQIFHALERYRQAADIVYELVFSHYWISGMVGEMAARRWGCPHVLMFHTIGALKKGTAGEKIDPERLETETRLASSATAIVAPTLLEHRHIMQWCQVGSGKIHIVPCGVNRRTFSPGPQPKARRALGCGEKEAVVLYVGRVTPVKGLDLLLDAVGRLTHSGVTMRLLVVGGDGPAADSTRTVQQQVRRLRIADRVAFLGRQAPSTLVNFYRAATLVAVPSRYESFGLVVLEALSCGTPVVATPVGIVPEVIKNGDCGAIIPAPHADAAAETMANALARFHRTPPDSNALRAVTRPFCWGAIADKLAALFRSVGCRAPEGRGV